jgi:D-alanyl-D-alanine dipeptidase
LPASQRTPLEGCPGQWLSPDAAQAFNAAERELERMGIHMDVTSAGRTYQDQARLYAERGSNPNPVAPPGTSNHEGGNAVDLANASDPRVERVMNKDGFYRDVSGDPVHYDYRGSTATAHNRTGSGTRHA